MSLIDELNIKYEELNKQEWKIMNKLWVHVLTQYMQTWISDLEIKNKGNYIDFLSHKNNLIYFIFNKY